MLDLVCEDDSVWGEFFWNWAKTTKKVMWGEKNSSQPRGWEYAQKWCHPESLERLEEGAIYRSSKVPSPLCWTKSLLLRLKSGPFGNVLFAIYSLCMHIYIMFLLFASFVDVLCISLRLLKCTYWIIHVLLLFCFFAGWSGWDNHRNGQDGPLFGEDAASISSSINEK